MRLSRKEIAEKLPPFFPGGAIDFICAHQDAFREAFAALHEHDDPYAAPILYELYRAARLEWPSWFKSIDLDRLRGWAVRVTWLLAWCSDHERQNFERHRREDQN